MQKKPKNRLEQLPLELRELVHRFASAYVVEPSRIWIADDFMKGLYPRELVPYPRIRYYLHTLKWTDYRGETEHIEPLSWDETVLSPNYYRITYKIE